MISDKQNWYERKMERKNYAHFIMDIFISSLIGQSFFLLFSHSLKIFNYLKEISDKQNWYERISF
jgi:hypothetical protein